MSTKTAVGGFDDDWGSWLTLMALLASLGILPKAWRPAVGVAGGAVAIYKILKKLGWL